MNRLYSRSRSGSPPPHREGVTQFLCPLELLDLCDFIAYDHSETLSPVHL